MNYSYWCDGHHISATDSDDARSAVESLYGYSPDVVRLWTPEDDDA